MLSSIMPHMEQFHFGTVIFQYFPADCSDSERRIKGIVG
ncbi:hypothetical protein KKC1_02240 [Calderihabitans maritimus]|uniref:Uncharacterized protein n=1 Tax=Calderihabitans maritimus TaxID=1246530 RepID=A0A1Z5HNF4_9FIRM|nr:hypothetical protein KKC1_02240 [Calderihabitans maritimus]